MFDIWMRRRRVGRAQRSIPERALVHNIFAKTHLPALPTARFDDKNTSVERAAVESSLLSESYLKSMQDDAKIHETGKPQIIMDYNLTKGGVDTLKKWRLTMSPEEQTSGL
ncbi:hypothetical protein EVAR_76521_1 [Eumeta japonica]|uniref:Uncharacterized protein n=1 Tax=Eumeta variegata TaxID=151549 RepID=A0A4C1T7H8_EUMVA|nr:hypothetical protein EVAR_76521_1 [Eumeta japonica]